MIIRNKLIIATIMKIMIIVMIVLVILIVNYLIVAVPRRSWARAEAAETAKPDAFTICWLSGKRKGGE